MTSATDQHHPVATVTPPSDLRSGRLQRFRRAVQPRLVLLALAITCTHIVIATLSGRGDTWSERYRSLWTFDGGWYADILDHGYRMHSPPNAGTQYNVAFFPGYPVAAAGVQKLFNLSSGVALLVTAQLFAWLFYYVVLRALHHWRVASGISLAALVLLFCQPGAFYMVVAYSESLFLSALLIFLLLGRRAGSSTGALIVAALAGYAMTATRIVGAPLAAIPLIWAVLDARQMPQGRSFRGVFSLLWRHGTVAVVTAMGAISFFIYCAVRFGHWNEYMRAREIGWFGTKADFTAMFMLERFRVFIPGFYEGFLSHGGLTRLYIPLLTFLFVGVLILDAVLSRRRIVRNYFERVPLYVAAGVLFVLSASNSNPVYLYTPGFIRYGLYPFILLVIAAAHAYAHSKWEKQPLPPGVQTAVLLTGAVGLTLQLQLCWQFARGVFLA